MSIFLILRMQSRPLRIVRRQHRRYYQYPSHPLEKLLAIMAAAKPSQPLPFSVTFRWSTEMKAIVADIVLAPITDPELTDSQVLTIISGDRAPFDIALAPGTPNVTTEGIAGCVLDRGKNCIFRLVKKGLGPNFPLSPVTEQQHIADVSVAPAQPGDFKVSFREVDVPDPTPPTAAVAAAPGADAAQGVTVAAPVADSSAAPPAAPVADNSPAPTVPAAPAAAPAA
jgi:hypothetical protein